MKVVATKVFRENREKISTDVLRQYDGQWVAFSSDGCRVVASGKTISEVSARLDVAKHDIQDVLFEKIELDNGEIHLGGAALL